MSRNVTNEILMHFRSAKKRALDISMNAPMTQQEVAYLLGISRSYVSRIETKVLAMLRKKLEE